MKKTKIKKWMAFLLSVVMAVTLFPLQASAVSGASDLKTTSAIALKSSDGTETFYDTLYEAAYAAGDGDTILLYDDVEMGFFQLDGKRQKPTVTIEGMSITLDGQGHTVTAKDEAFSMIEVRPGGKITVKDITLDGSSAENRAFSNIINIEGGEAYIEEGAILTNNRTAAVGIGTNVPGGKCVMNGGMITGNTMPAGSNDTGVAVTVLEESTFIMNGGIISDNHTEKYGSSGIMANRGGRVILNGGIIENNSTVVSGMASAIHIKGGNVEINDGVIIRNNTSANGYGAIYVTDHSSFGEKWDGILDIKGGQITENKNADGTMNAIYLWDRSSVAEKGAYIYFSGSPEIKGTSIIYANSSSSVDYKPLQVEGQFTPKRTIIIEPLFYYIIGQTIVEYGDGLIPNSAHFIAPVDNYGFQEDKENNVLYTEQKRYIDFWNGNSIIKNLSYWEFVEDYVKEPSADDVSKAGYTLEGWYTDKALTNKWDFEKDKLTREEDTFNLYVEWEAIPAQAPSIAPTYPVNVECGDEEYVINAPEFEKQEGYEYTYQWIDDDGNIVGDEDKLTVLLEVGNTADYTLTITAKRLDNGEEASVSTVYQVSRDEHQFGDWLYDEEYHYKECTSCGKIIDEGAHQFRWVIDREATSSQTGVKHEECSVCGYEKDPIEIPVIAAPVDEQADAGMPPKTDDINNMMPLIMLLVISAGCFAVVSLADKKRAERRN